MASWASPSPKYVSPHPLISHDESMYKWGLYTYPSSSIECTARAAIHAPRSTVSAALRNRAALHHTAFNVDGVIRTVRLSVGNSFAGSAIDTRSRALGSRACSSDSAFKDVDRSRCRQSGSEEEGKVTKEHVENQYNTDYLLQSYPRIVDRL